MSDPYCNYDEIEAEFQISRETIRNIIHNCLKQNLEILKSNR
jgi:hypothetical protein